MGDWISFLAGVSLLVISPLVIRAYSPGGFHFRTGNGWLAAAIILGFLAAAGNTLYWQVFGVLAVKSGLMTVTFQRELGDWCDLLFKGGGALSGWMHLKALQRSLPEEDQPYWRAIEMPWYPHRRACLRRLTGNLPERKRK